jgi:hypothetical protein
LGVESANLISDVDGVFLKRLIIFNISSSSISSTMYLPITLLMILLSAPPCNWLSDKPMRRRSERKESGDPQEYIKKY